MKPGPGAPRRRARAQRLQPYPFERLRQLFATVTPSPDYPAISLGIGEPRHATPEFIKSALTAALDTGLASYPATAGEPTFAKPARPGCSGATVWS
jgi:N-succinyldiaminopimelate aminotransferase